MDPLTIILATVALAAFAGLAYMAGYELGQANASAPRNTRPTVTQLVKRLNKQKPRVTTKGRASK